MSRFILNIIVSAQNNASRVISSIGSTARSSFSQASMSALSASGSIAQFGRSLISVGSQLGMTIFGIQALYQAAVSLGSAFLSGNASMEQMQIAFEGLLKSEALAKKLMADMWDFAAKTPFEFPQLAASSRLLLAFGFNLESILPMMRDIGDTVAGLGGGSFEIDRVVRALGQMQAKGKIAAQEMMQMAELGIPAWDMLAKGLGKTTAETMKLSELGLIPADKAIRILLDGMHQTFGGQMQRQSLTFNGLMSTFKDNVAAAWRSFTGPLFIKAKDALIELGNIVTSPEFQALAKDWGEKVGEGINKAAIVVKWLASAIKDVVSNADKLNLVKAVLTELGIAAAIAFTMWAISAAQAAIMTIAATWPVLLVIAAITLLIYGIYELIQHWDAISAALGRFKNRIGEVAGVIGRFIGGVFSKLGSFARWIADGIESLGSTIGNALGGAFTNAKDAIGKILYSLLAFIVGLFILQFRLLLMIPGVKLVIGMFQQMMNDIVRWVKLGLAGIQIAFSFVLRAIGVIVTLAMALIRQYIVQPIQNIWNMVRTIFTLFAGWLTGWFAEQVGGFFSWLGSIGRSIADGAGAVLDEVKKTVIDPVTNLFSEMLKNALNWGSQLLTNFIDGIKQKWTDFTNILGEIKDTGNKWLQGGSPPPLWPEQGLWGQTLMKNLTQGITSSLPMLRLALGQIRTTTNPVMAPTRQSGVALASSSTSSTHISMSFPNVTSSTQVVDAYNKLQSKREETNYRKARRPGAYQGFRAGV